MEIFDNFLTSSLNNFLNNNLFWTNILFLVVQFIPNIFLFKIHLYFIAVSNN